MLLIGFTGFGFAGYSNLMFVDQAVTGSYFRRHEATPGEASDHYRPIGPGPRLHLEAARILTYAR
jgi:hypothetical protein